MPEGLRCALMLFAFATVICSSQQRASIIMVEDAEAHTLSASTSASMEYELRTPKGGKLLVTLEQLRMDVQMGDYLMVKRGPHADDDGTGMVYSGVVKLPAPTILVASDVVLIKAHLANAGDFERQFQLQYRWASSQALQTTTTTARPSSRPPWPAPGPGDRTYLTIYVSGQPDHAYRDEELLTNLRRGLRNMATAYCKSSLIELKQPVRVSNVLISELKRCPYAWPDSSDCVEVAFALPVVLADAAEGYQLLAMHLQVMWERHHDLLRPYALKRYAPPDLGMAMAWWNGILGAILSVLALTTCIILAARECCPRLLRRQPALDLAVDLPAAASPTRASIVSNASQFERFKEKANGFALL